MVEAVEEEERGVLFGVTGVPSLPGGPAWYRKCKNEELVLNMLWSGHLATPVFVRGFKTHQFVTCSGFWACVYGSGCLLFS